MEEPRFFRFLTAKRFLMEAPAFPKVGMGRAASGGRRCFSAPLGCSPLRSLSQSPRPPEAGPDARGAGPDARAGRQAVASLPVRWGGDGRFGSMDGWGGGRKRSLRSLSAGRGGGRFGLLGDWWRQKGSLSEGMSLR